MMGDRLRLLDSLSVGITIRLFYKDRKQGVAKGIVGHDGTHWKCLAKSRVAKAIVVDNEGWVVCIDDEPHTADGYCYVGADSEVDWDKRESVNTRTTA